MTQILEWPRIAVVGAGAVGGYFGGMLANAGAPVVMIGRQSFVEAVTSNGLLIESAQGDMRVRVDATIDISAVANADIILFCVKTSDTEAAGKAVAAVMKRDAQVVSLQNGVDNAECIRTAGGIEAWAAAV